MLTWRRAGGIFAERETAAPRLQSKMDRPWHFVHGGQAQGPVDGAALVQLALQGVVSADTLVWSSGRGEWVSFASVSELVQGLQKAEQREPGGQCRLLCSAAAAAARFSGLGAPFYSPCACRALVALALQASSSLFLHLLALPPPPKRSRQAGTAG